MRIDRVAHDTVGWGWTHRVLVTLVAFVLIGNSLPTVVSAATIGLSTSKTQVTVGDVFSLRVAINTNDKVINNAEADIRFPTDLVEVVSVSPSGSIFSLWVEAPSFSNSDGRISFNGGIPNPGYSGAGGTVMSAVFKAKKAGTATFLFSSAAIRENDGLGTNILTGQGTATLTIVSSEKEPVPVKPAEPIVEEKKPTAGTFSLSSPTHPNQNSWYSTKNVTMSWTLPPDTTSIQTVVGVKTGSTPNVTYTPPIYRRNLNLADGIWYFHMRYRTGATWYAISRYKLQIDSVSPYDLKVATSTEADGSIGVSVSASDDLSGVDRFEIKVDGKDAVSVSAPATEPYRLPELAVGDHTVLVSAFDRAGNTVQASTTVSVNMVSSPRITVSPLIIPNGSTLEVRGTSTYPRSTATIWIKDAQGQSRTVTVISDDDGSFVYQSEPMTYPGTFELTARMTDVSGKQSPLSEMTTVQVEAQAVAAQQIPEVRTTQKVTPLSFVLMGLLALMLVVFGYGWYRFAAIRRQLRSVETKADRAHLLLLKKAGKEVQTLEKVARRRGSVTPVEAQALASLKEIIEHLQKE